MNAKYTLSKRKYGDKVTYGIKVVYTEDNIFSKKSDAKNFINLCNKMKLSEVHFDDVLSDYLLEQNIVTKR